jgi:methylated-DNA-protein-cysteine methyltransferase-like protein
MLNAPGIGYIWVEDAQVERRKAMDEGFFQRVYGVVRQIPRGSVTTYGQIARMIGEPRKARYVGFAMHASPGVAGGVPCHRVVFADGSLAPGFAFGGADEQRCMLEDEGVAFLPSGKVDLRRCGWPQTNDPKAGERP